MLELELLLSLIPANLEAAGSGSGSGAVPVPASASVLRSSLFLFFNIKKNLKK
jgi:hypothetical protein